MIAEEAGFTLPAADPKNYPTLYALGMSLSATTRALPYPEEPELPISGDAVARLRAAAALTAGARA
ncbi:hypothetical protein [Brevibacterium moorei]|uniref:hypothetical protein n=1 Tax=Brevibacterium moorei TaxID=2968457 RepID=UPI00211B8939|nr:hypothetical protein [Brevibacterium sp. 68QC2CO]MCQ9384378.1 hypothetical protein [Brevibacterium sp. 68QC2CO]